TEPIRGGPEWVTSGSPTGGVVIRVAVMVVRMDQPTTYPDLEYFNVANDHNLESANCIFSKLILKVYLFKKFF
ncbi:3059_t:CDS:2, partial [Ambispora leptoticha]